MREIKFRAYWEWNMLEWADIQHHPGWRLFPTPEQYEDWHIMQYTGLHDKNGKEIYEGDIVYAHRNRGRYQVLFGEHELTGEYVDLCCGFYIERIDKDFSVVTNIESIGRNAPEVFEVIGNIYENPELVGNGKKET